MKDYVFNVEPMGKPRMTQSDKWRKREVVVRYFNLKTQMKIIAKRLKYEPKDQLSMTFVISMPKSWSKKKKEKMNGQPHKQKPDLDNAIKGVQDILCVEDSHIWKYGEMKKIWGTKGKIIIHEE